MDRYMIVNRQYDAGRYTPEQVPPFVQARKITEAEVADIVDDAS